MNGPLLRFLPTGRLSVCLRVFVCAFSMAMPAAYADTLVYKFTGQDGVTVYSQTLPKDYRPADVHTIVIETLPADEQHAAIRMLAAMEKESKEVDARLKARHEKLAIADQQVAAAIKNLEQAESDLEKGSVPTAGDWFGDRSRLIESYFLRVARLQGEVEKAKHALDEAYRNRSNLR